LIIGAGELAFTFGFDANLTDDVRLGYFSGGQGRFYVQNRWYQEWLQTSARTEPAAYRHVQVFSTIAIAKSLRNPGYTIYELR
jgi:hypothetical protein